MGQGTADEALGNEIENGRSLIAQDNKLLEDDGTTQARNWSMLQPHNHKRQANKQGTRSLNQLWY